MFFEWLQIVLSLAALILIIMLAVSISNIRQLDEKLSKLFTEKAAAKDISPENKHDSASQSKPIRYVQSMLAPSGFDNDDELTAAVMGAIAAYEEDIGGINESI